MGCGASSSTVESFNNPEENRNYKQNHEVKKSSRKSSSSSQSSSDSDASDDKRKRQKHRKKSKSSSSSAGSACGKKADEDNRATSTDFQRTYTVKTPNSNVNDNKPVTPQCDTDKHNSDNVDIVQETNILSFEIDNDQTETEVNEADFDTKQHYEELQKQTFLTGDPSEKGHNERMKDDKTRLEEHEKIAQKKEEKRASYDIDKREEDKIKELGLVALVIPEMEDHMDRTKEYTIDDIVQHNAEVGAKDWFKYGKKIYSWTKMCPIIKERMEQYAKKVWNHDLVIQGPILYDARRYGVTRKELTKILPVCHVGTCVDVPRDQYLSRMKQSVESVLTEKAESEEFKDYINQLSRWLSVYPMNNIYNVKIEGNLDPNEQKFPLPADIQSDPLILRKWIKTWEPFDLEVPEEGAWHMAPLSVREDLGDTHETFINCLRVIDEATPPFDMTIDGNVPWTEIELNLFKNDTTTAAQDAVWKKRALRSNVLDDPEWMAKRRGEVTKTLKERYERMQKPYNLERYIGFTKVLQKHWNEFQELCEKEFVPPKRAERKSISLKACSEYGAVDGGDIIEKRHIESQDTDGEREPGGTEKDVNSALSEHTNDDTDKLEKADSGLELDGLENGMDDQGPEMNGDVTARTDDGRDSIQLTARQDSDDGLMRRA